MAVKEGKPADVLRLITSRLTCPMKGNARLYIRRQACLAHHAEMGVNAPIVPIVVGMFIFLALGDYHCVVNDSPVRMGDKILDSRIEGSRMFEIFLNAAHIEIDADEGWEAGLFGAVQHPETGGLATREVAETLERRAPEGFIHGGVVECPYHVERAFVDRHDNAAPAAKKRRISLAYTRTAPAGSSPPNTTDLPPHTSARPAGTPSRGQEKLRSILPSAI